MEMNCPLCEAPTSRVLSETLRRGEGRVLYCEPCGLGFLDAPAVDVEAYYRDEYRREVSHRAQGGETNAQELFDVYRKFQGERLGIVLPHVRKNDAVLEIGASAGQFLTHLRHETRDLSATELDPECCAFMGAQGIDADDQLLPNSRHWDRRFDIVCAFQVMEHVDDPAQFLREVAHVMKPGARAFIEVPNLNDPLLALWEIDAYRKFFFHAQHRFYFTRHPLMAVARAAGFEHIEVLPTQDYNVLNHLHWIMNGTPQPTCEIGLGETRILGADLVLANWLSLELRALNERYIQLLKQREATSNFMMILKKGSP